MYYISGYLTTQNRHLRKEIKQGTLLDEMQFVAKKQEKYGNEANMKDGSYVSPITYLRVLYKITKLVSI